MGKNSPNLGLATRQSLDTLKDINASILPKYNKNPMIFKGREREDKSMYLNSFHI
jgi:hypothetical protein